LGENDLGSALHVEPGGTIWHLNHDTHAFAARVEWDKLERLGVCALLGDGAHGEVVLGEEEESSLGLGTDEGLLAVNFAFEGGRVQSDGLDEDLLHLGAQHLGKFRNRDLGGIIGFQGGIIIRVGAGWPGAAKAMRGANGAGHHLHLVLRQRARLV
jgi:hypothetical protein